MGDLDEGCLVATPAEAATPLRPVPVPSSAAVPAVPLEVRIEVSSGSGRLALVVVSDASRTTGQSGLLEGGGHNLWRQGEVGPQVLDALIREVVVVPLPVEGLLDVALGLERSK